MRSILLILCGVSLASAQDATSLALAQDTSATAKHERVEFTLKNVQHLVFGDVLVEAEDGGILLEARNQTIWPLQPDEIQSRKLISEGSDTLTKKELATEVLKEYRRRTGFQPVRTVIFSVAISSTCRFLATVHGFTVRL